MEPGAKYKNGSCTFTVWAPRAGQMAVRLLTPERRLLPMERRERGYWQAEVEDVPPGSRYLLQIENDLERPDPASFHQPEGVHGPSEVVDHGAFSWTDRSWRGRSLEELIVYELHVGTFTPEGTFTALIPRLADLRDLGITTIQVMPVAQFPGRRNWGYDGAYSYAVQHSYGGPDGLKQLVDAAHGHGLAVILDVVYNHLGPEGNYLRDFGPYFTDRYRTPWGEAINFDGPYSDEVRHFFIENARCWYRHYHVDGLRLDAVHAIYDFSARPFLQELAQSIKEMAGDGERPCHLIAESDLNDVRVIRPRAMGGFGLDAQFNEDFHHALHGLLTGENQGYYADFGRMEDLATAYRQGFVYDWRYSPYRRRHHGSSSADLPARQLLAFIQNHDQVGNRLQGERLAALAGFEKAKLAAAALLLSPYIPLIFMGEEYAEKAPFLYFTEFSDSNLIEAVRKGRKEEFGAFAWEEEPPDPHDPEVLVRSRLDWTLREQEPHRTMLSFYRRLLDLRRTIPALAVSDREHLLVAVEEEGRTFWFRRGQGGARILCLMNFGEQPVDLAFPEGEGRKCWREVLDSAAAEWLGPDTKRAPEPAGEGEAVRLAPWSCRLYRDSGPEREG